MKGDNRPDKEITNTAPTKSKSKTPPKSKFIKMTLGELKEALADWVTKVHPERKLLRLKYAINDDINLSIETSKR